MFLARRRANTCICAVIGQIANFRAIGPGASREILRVGRRTRRRAIQDSPTHEHTKPYVGIVSAIEKLARYRNNVMTRAFAVLELHHPALAELVLQSTRCRSEAALWMFRPHRALGGKTGYQAFVDDNEEILWDELTLTLQSA